MREIKGEAAVLVCNVLIQISFTAFLKINKYLKGIFWAVVGKFYITEKLWRCSVYKGGCKQKEKEQKWYEDYQITV